MANILIINADYYKKSIKPYILNTLFDACDEIFMASEKINDFTKVVEKQLPKKYEIIIIYDPYVYRFLLKNELYAKVHIIDKDFPFREDNKENKMPMIYINYYSGALLIGLSNLDNVFYLSQEDVERKSNIISYHIYENTTYGLSVHMQNQRVNIKTKKSVWHVTGASDYNIIQGGYGSQEIEISGKSSYNKAHGSSEVDNLSILQDASHNTLNGYNDEDILIVSNTAKYNTLNGGSDSDELEAIDDAQYNRLNGGSDSDRLKAKGDVKYNTLNGDEDGDKLSAEDCTAYNILNGGNGFDHLEAKDSAHHNELNGDKGKDTLIAFNNASNNIFRGGKDDDLLLAYGNAISNTLNGDENNDTLISTTSNILKGGSDDDFLMGYFASPNYASDCLITLNGNEDHDTLIGSFIPWFFNDEKEKNLLTQWTFEGEKGNDWIFPHLSSHYIQTDRLRREIRYDVDTKITSLSQTMKSSDKILNAQYDISLGEGTDTLLLSSQKALNAQTHITDLSLDEDLIAFDTQDFASVFTQKIHIAQTLNVSQAIFDYQGHHYVIDIPQQQTLSLQSDKDILGLDILTPIFPASNTLSFSYGLYHLIDKVNPLTLRNDLNISKMSFSKTLTVTLDKNIYVSLKPTLDIVCDKDNKQTVFWENHQINLSFTIPFLFEEEQTKIKLCEDITTGTVQYFESAENTYTPPHIVAVIVQQKNNNGLIFTTKTEDRISPFPFEKNNISEKMNILANEENNEQSLLKSYLAIEFFEKGHFVKMDGKEKNPSQSLDMRVGFVFKGNDGNLITTPLSDTICIKLINKLH